jgi:hypothetical protein
VPTDNKCISQEKLTVCHIKSTVLPKYPRTIDLKEGQLICGKVRIPSRLAFYCKNGNTICVDVGRHFLCGAWFEKGFNFVVYCDPKSSFVLRLSQWLASVMPILLK